MADKFFLSSEREDKRKQTEISNENGSEAACRSSEVCSRIVNDPDWCSVLMSRHVELFSNELGIDLVVDFADLGECHKGHGVCVDTDHDAFLSDTER